MPIGPGGPWSHRVDVRAREFLRRARRSRQGRSIQFRLDHLGGAEKLTAGELTIERPRLRRVLEVLRAKSDWGKPMPKGSGRGMACNVYDGDTHVAYTAEVTVRDGHVRVDRVVCVLDCGLIVNPSGIESQIEGGVIWSLSSASEAKSRSRLRPEQSSYRDSSLLRIAETPMIEVHLIPRTAGTHSNRSAYVPPMVPA